MSGRAGASSDRTAARSETDVPLGIIVIAVLGMIVTVLGFVGSLRVMSQSGGPLLLKGLLLVVSVGQLIVLLGLLALEPWAWTWGLVLFSIGGLINLLELDLVGLIVSLVIVFYLSSKADYYR